MPDAWSRSRHHRQATRRSQHSRNRLYAVRPFAAQAKAESKSEAKPAAPSRSSLKLQAMKDQSHSSQESEGPDTKHGRRPSGSRGAHSVSRGSYRKSLGMPLSAAAVPSDQRTFIFQKRHDKASGGREDDLRPPHHACEARA